MQRTSKLPSAGTPAPAWPRIAPRSPARAAPRPPGSNGHGLPATAGVEVRLDRDLVVDFSGNRVVVSLDIADLLAAVSPPDRGGNGATPASVSPAPANPGREKPQRLTAAFVRSVEATDRPARYGDGNGLYLLVKPGLRGGKSWVQRISIHGTRRDMGLGSVRLVSLDEARQRALENQKLARAGGDPRPRRPRTPPSFADAAETVIEMYSPTWKKGGRTAGQWRASLAQHVLPRIGTTRVDAVTRADVMAILLPLWTERHETARRIRRRIVAVMQWAIVQGYRKDNPADEDLEAALPKVSRRPQHQRALPHAEVGAALRRVRAAPARPGARLAMELMVLCAVRSSEARHAAWPEFDIDAATWAIPAERMKSKRVHRVPLSDAALAVLDQAAALREGDLVFPSRVRNRPLASGTLVNLLRDLDIDAVPHGFRSSFRDWAAEMTDTPHAVMEAALAHTVHDSTVAAYARSDLFDRRRELMGAWADYLAEAG